MSSYKPEEIWTAFDVLSSRIADSDEIGQKRLRQIKIALTEYFEMIRHLKKTPLWDIFEYEKKLEQPLDLLVYENNHLKEEINKLHKKLGIKEKYKTNPYDYMFQDEYGFRDKE